jgi:competence protein ComEC
VPSSADPSFSASGRRMLVRAAAFAAGIGLSLPRRTIASPWLLLSLLTLSLIPQARIPPRTRSSGAARLARALGTSLLCLGIGASLGWAHRLLDPSARLLAEWRRAGFAAGETPMLLSGRIEEVQASGRQRVAMVLRVERYRPPGATGGRQVEVDGVVRARLTVPQPEKPAGSPWIAGDRVEVSARLGLPRSFANPGGFDYRTYLQARGVALSGTIKSPRLVHLHAPSGPLQAPAARLRYRLVNRLREACGPAGATTAAFLAALLVGERAELPETVETILRRAGVYHIIAVSGLNVGLVALFAASILAVGGVPPRKRRPWALLAVILYGALARGSGSIDRATTMMSLFLVGGMGGRPSSAGGTVGMTAILLLAARPCWAADAGFQLSFMATIGILVFGRPGGAAHQRSGIAHLWVRRSLQLSGGALLGTALIGAVHFQMLAPVAFLANLIAVPAVSLLLPMAFGAAFMPHAAAPLAAILTGAAGRVLRILLRACECLASVPGASFQVVPPASVLVLGACTAVVAAAMLRRRARSLVAAAIVTMLLAVALGGRGEVATGRLEIVALDVGQGDSILIVFPSGTTMLIDAGGFAGSDFDVGSRVVAPALRALGHLHLDILAVTHAHRDHYGGAEAILREFAPRALWLGRMPPGHAGVERLIRQAGRTGTAVLYPHRGVRLRLGGAELRILHPDAGSRIAPHGANEDSLVIRLRYARRAALFTGDLEREVEGELARGAWPLASGLLKVAHHGSRTSTTPVFLERVAPRLAVISVGASNPWGHPDATVLRRLRRDGVRIFRTDIDGAVGFVTDGLDPWRGCPLTGGSRPRAADSGNLQPSRHQAEDEDDESQPGHDDPPPTEIAPFMHHGRMTGPQHQDQHREDDQVGPSQQETGHDHQREDEAGR